MIDDSILNVELYTQKSIGGGMARHSSNLLHLQSQQASLKKTQAYGESQGLKSQVIKVGGLGAQNIQLE